MSHGSADLAALAANRVVLEILTGVAGRRAASEGWGATRRAPRSRAGRESARVPGCVEGLPRVGTSADEDVVTAAHVHREACLHRVPPVVSLDQPVHVAEVVATHLRPPAILERARIAFALPGKLVPARLELGLVLGSEALDSRRRSM